MFVCGISGTGRATTVQRILDRIKGYCRVPPDRCYVHNFRRPHEPRLIALPRNLGRRLSEEMERLRRHLPKDCALLLSSNDHARRRARVIARMSAEGDRILESLERRAGRRGFTIGRTGEGAAARPELRPRIEGRPYAIHDLDRLVAEGRLTRARADQIRARYEALRDDLEAASRAGADLIRRMEQEIAQTDRDHVGAALRTRMEAIAGVFPEAARADVAAYLEEVLEETLRHLHLFSPQPGPAAGAPGIAAPAPPADDEERAESLASLLQRFEVNVIFESSRTGECPVLVETHPSYRRLFGHLEKSLDPSGHWVSDYTRVRSGSLLDADGGYLVLKAEDVLTDPDVWKELKRTLIGRRLAIREEPSMGASPAATLQPEPIPIHVKVILIGGRDLYDLLLSEEGDFRKLFKVLADFDEDMPRTPGALRQYAAFSRRICSDEGLGPPDPGALGAVAEYGARLAGHQRRLSTRFGEIADILREADYWRREEGRGGNLRARHVRSAITETIRRLSMPEDRLRRMFRDGQILVECKGARVAQVNGLVIHESGRHSFGLPARVTATVSPGTAGIINIEREADLSGTTHTKGVLLISGYLRERFGTDKPVTLTASVALEQSYWEIDGDSASSTEVYALLSALADLPLAQGIAVTGSVDQKGDIQPVGGINDKIEGFYRVCRSKGPQRDQGVITPASNLPELMLDEEVVEAVRRGRFHIWPVRRVEEGIALLTGVPAGRRRRDGTYPEDSVFGRVDRRLRRFNEIVRDYGGLPRL